MKRFLFRLILIASLLGAGFLWFQQSIYGSMLALYRAVETSELEQIEKYADLKGLRKTYVDYTEVVVEDEAGKVAGDLGRMIVKGAASLLSGLINENDRQHSGDNQGINEMRAVIAEGEVKELLGPFNISQDFSTFFNVTDAPNEGKYVKIVGSCHSQEVSVRVRFRRIEKGGYLPFLGYYKAVSVDKESLRHLHQVCSKSRK